MYKDNLQAILDNIQQVQAGFVLQEATWLALNGNRRQATELLEGCSVHTAETYDLLARIKAQAGRYDDAEKYWQRVISISPGNAGALIGLKRIAKIRNQTRVRRIVSTTVSRFPGLAILAGALVVIALSVFFWKDDYSTLSSRADHSTPGTQTEPQSGSSPLANTILSPGDSGMSVLDHMSEDLVRDSAIRVSKTGEGIRIEFTGGLFSKGTTLKMSKTESIRRVATVLKEYNDVMTLKLVGCTDPRSLKRGSSYRSNEHLALQRSFSVYEILVESAPELESRVSFGHQVMKSDGKRETAEGDLPSLRTVYADINVSTSQPLAEGGK